MEPSLPKGSWELPWNRLAEGKAPQKFARRNLWLSASRQASQPQRVPLLAAVLWRVGGGIGGL